MVDSLFPLFSDRSVPFPPVLFPFFPTGSIHCRPLRFHCRPLRPTGCSVLASPHCCSAGRCGPLIPARFVLLLSIARRLILLSSSSAPSCGSAHPTVIAYSGYLSFCSASVCCHPTSFASVAAPCNAVLRSCAPLRIPGMRIQEWVAYNPRTMRPPPLSTDTNYTKILSVLER